MGWLNNNACVYCVSHAFCLLNSFQQFGQDSSHISGSSTSYIFHPQLSVHKTMLQYNFCSEKPNMMQKCIKVLLFLILNEAQHVLGDTPPIIKRLKLHWQPLVLYTWKVVGRAVVGRCQVAYTSICYGLHVRQPSTYAKPDAACAVLGS